MDTKLKKIDKKRPKIKKIKKKIRLETLSPATSRPIVASKIKDTLELVKEPKKTHYTTFKRTAPARYISVKPSRKKTPDFLNTSELLRSAEKISYEKKSHVYSYKLTDVLNTDFETLHGIVGKTKIHLCIYRINDSALFPFLEYFLYKWPKSSEPTSDMLMFPYKKFKGDTSVLNFANKFSKDLLKKSIVSDGYLSDKKNIYIFYNVGAVKNIVEELSRKNNWWWTLISEITNFKKVLNFPIYSSVTSLFLKYPLLNYLFDGSGKVIEIPTVAFHGTYYKLVPFVTSYGIKASSLNAMMGPYYYFGTFRKVVRYAGWTSTYKPRYINGELITDDDGRYINTEDPEHGNAGGIVRFALFLGKMKAFLNHPTDRDDMNDKLKARIEKNPYNRAYEMRIVKMHDHAGLWTKDFDSVYVGRAKLSNEKLFMTNPEFVVKTFDQQIVLSTHMLDKTTLQPNWNNSYDHYHIA